MVEITLTEAYATTAIIMGSLFIILIYLDLKQLPRRRRVKGGRPIGVDNAKPSPRSRGGRKYGK